MNRLLILVLLTVLLSIGGGQKAHANVPLLPTPTTELSPQTLVALSSSDYVTVGMALFSAQSQADINALDGLFQRLLKRELTRYAARTADRPPTLSQRLMATITGVPTVPAINTRTLSSLKPGDVVLRRSNRDGCATRQTVPGCRAWAAVYDHAALYYGTVHGIPMIYESTPQRGVRLVPLSRWQQRGIYVGIYRPKRALLNQRSACATFVQRYGSNGRTQFNATQTNKASDTTVSSAQLVWLYYRTHGINIDSNNSLYAHWLRTGYSPLVASYVANHAVAPDEIALSPALTRVAHGWLP
ncbi:MAG: YiiX/YebB-like N1pC/P60 family cysteine hydrolase [Roseiflexaceae bacterium]